MELAPHLRQTLIHVVEQAIQTGEPIGSQFLVRACGLDVSPATIRNYFSALEQAGYLSQPHTSSGRLPTEQGYRYYVEAVLSPRVLSKREKTELQSAAKSEDSSIRFKSLAKAGAEIAQSAIFIRLGNMDSYYTGLTYLFNQPEFRDWNRIVSLTDVLDRLDDVLIGLGASRFAEPSVQIGSDCPFGPMCTSILCSLPEGGVIGLLAPMRTDYGLGISLMKEIVLLIYEETH